MDELPWPLRGWEAVDAGLLTVRELRRFYVPVYPDVHVLRGVELSAAQTGTSRVVVVATPGCDRRLVGRCDVGRKWIEPGLPAELVHTNRRQPPMLIVHSDDVEPARRHGRRHAVTTAARTAFDIGQAPRTRRGRPACRRA